MKKTVMAVLLLILCMGLSACGGSKTEDQANEDPDGTSATTAGGYLKDYAAEDYVILGTYKGVKVDVDEPEVSEEYLNGYIDYALQSTPMRKEITDRALQTGDVANIDYEGRIDDVLFEGGSAKGYDLTIGSGSFISGFEDGCIGMKTGETRDVEAVFPDPYKYNPDLAGKTAVFTVTLNKIYEETPAELTDEYVQSLELENCSNVEDFRSYLYDVLMETEQANYEQAVQDAAFAAAAQACTFEEPPKAMVDRMNTTLTENLSSYALMYGMDIGTITSQYYGGEAEDYEATLRQEATVMAKNYLMVRAIADRENITVSEEEYRENIAREAEASGYPENAYEQMIDTEAFREYLLVQKVLEFLGNNAVAQ